jgi:hypothetical protein
VVEAPSFPQVIVSVFPITTQRTASEGRSRDGPKSRLRWSET